MKGQEPAFSLDVSVELEEKDLLGPYCDNQKLHTIIQCYNYSTVGLLYIVGKSDSILNHNLQEKTLSHL